MTRLKVAMIAPPWLRVPADGYGGVEAVIENLCVGLRELGMQVELFAVGGSTAPADAYHEHHDDEQFGHFMDPMYDAAAIPAAHILDAMRSIRLAGDFDIIHDHNNLFGPAIMAGRADLPPVLHTLHWPLKLDALREGNIDTSRFYGLLAIGRRLFFNCISAAQLAQATMQLRSRVVGVVPHGINAGRHTVTVRKDSYFVTVGRVAPVKGTAVAARLCRALGLPLKIAGQVGDLRGPAEVRAALDHEAGRMPHPDLKYFRDEVLPHLVPGLVEYVGGVGGRMKDELIGRARAFLMPIEWDEPFGVAVIEALACGTPVVAMRRGAMPEIIEHGVNGFLATSVQEFQSYLNRVGEIDPLACRRSVESKFSYNRMSRQYLELYRGVLARLAPVRARGTRVGLGEVLRPAKTRS